MTIDELGPEMVGLVPDLEQFVPPAHKFDKHVYSPWTGTDLRCAATGSTPSSSPAAKPMSA